MKKIYYEKRGRRYVPVMEYDNDLMDAMPKGNHLIMSYPGGTSRRYNIDPEYAAMIAAGRVAEDAISRAISAASELRPQRQLLTAQQKAAWRALADSFGDDLCTLQGASVRDCAEAGVKAMQAEADLLLTNPAVKRAWDQFMFIAALSKENPNG